MNKRFISFVISLFLSLYILLGQTIEKYDTIIKKQYYKSHLVTKPVLHVSYTIYKLYYIKEIKSVSRAGYSFHGNYKHFNYTKSGYDKGHLVPAEDMSFSKTSMEESFLWINCVPQTPKLNRGVWRSDEIKCHNYIYSEDGRRAANKSDTLIIISGGCDYYNYIPKYCFKAVWSVKSHKILNIFIYTNTNNPTPKPVSNEFREQIINILKENYYI